TEPQIREDISLDRLHIHFRVNLPGGSSRTKSLGLAFIRFAEQDRAAEVAQLDLIHIRNDDVTNAQQREVLEDFIPQRPGANDHDPGTQNDRLGPPLDLWHPRKATRLGVQGYWFSSRLSGGTFVRR